MKKETAFQEYFGAKYEDRLQELEEFQKNECGCCESNNLPEQQPIFVPKEERGTVLYS